MKEDRPAFLMYSSRFLSGILTLTMAERGAFITLLCYQWLDGSIPKDFDRLALICPGLTPEIWEGIKHKFIVKKGPLLINKRLEIIRKESKNYSKQQTNRVLKRWESKDKTPKKDVTKSIPDVYQIDTESIPSSTLTLTSTLVSKSSLKSSSSNSKEKSAKASVIYPFDTEEFKTAWEYWSKYRSTDLGKRKYKPTGEEAALSKLSRLADGNHELAIDIIKQSIENGWAGFFPLKNNHQKNKRNEMDRNYIPGTETIRELKKRFPESDLVKRINERENPENS